MIGIHEKTIVNTTRSTLNRGNEEYKKGKKCENQTPIMTAGPCFLNKINNTGIDLLFLQALMLGSVESDICDSGEEGNSRSRPRWARGGRCFAGFLGGAFQGKNTPVPPPLANLRGLTGANITIGGWRTPHSGPLGGILGGTYGPEIPGFQNVMAFIIEGVGGWY